MALCLAIGLLACLGTIFGLQLASKEPTEAPSFVIREIPESVVDGSFRHAEHYSVDPNSRLLLIPHHLVAGREIASLLTSASPKKRILLLSPDHFSIGDHALATTNKAFRWKEQTVRPDLALNKRLLAAFPTAFRVQDNIFEREHGVRGLVPFLTQAWPQASVNVMTVRNRCSWQSDFLTKIRHINWFQKRTMRINVIYVHNIHSSCSYSFLNKRIH
jgi:AmmeMemoRadiSam system protein B